MLSNFFNFHVPNFFENSKIIYKRIVPWNFCLLNCYILLMTIAMQHDIFLFLLIYRLALPFVIYYDIFDMRYFTVCINTHKFIISLYIILPTTISCLFCFLFSFSQILVFFYSLPRIYHIFLSIKLSYFLIYQKFHESFFYKHPFTSLVRIL